MEIMVPLQSEIINELQIIQRLKETHTQLMEMSYNRYLSGLEFEDLIKRVNIVQGKINNRKKNIAILTNLN